MANRTFTHPWTLDKNARHLHGSVTFGSSGAVASTSALGFAITKPSNTVGIYRCTMTDNYTSVLSAAALLDNAATPKGLHFEISNVDLTAGANVVDFLLSAGRRTVDYEKGADGAANTATAETTIGVLPEGGTLLGAWVTGDAGVTADDTNYATITLRKRTSAGASATSIATLSTTTAGSGTWTAFAPEAFTVVTAASANVVAAGSSLTLEISKPGSGVQLPIIKVILLFALPCDATSGDIAYFTMVLRDGAAPRVGS